MLLNSLKNRDGMEVIWMIVTVYASYFRTSFCLPSLDNFYTTRCQDEPPSIEHGKFKPYSELYSSTVFYECDEGYTLNESGSSEVKCLAGKWEGTPPTCKDNQCFQRDLKNTLGLIKDDAPTSSWQHMTVNCSDGFSYTSMAPLCLRGNWLEIGDPCKKIAQCDPPDAPEYGSVQVTGGKPIVYSKAIFTCDEGRYMTGSNTSVCLPTKEWSSPTPKCFGLCFVPEISHGSIGRYEISPDTFLLRFKKLSVGSKLVNGEDLYLQCETKYDALGKTSTEEPITCMNGEWSDPPRCDPASCSTKPPETPNSRIERIDWNHGGIVVYECLRHYIKTQNESVTCDFGSWKGGLPECSDTRCYLGAGNFPRLLMGNKRTFFSGQSFLPVCKRSYRVTKPNDKLTCESGNWKGPSHPCTLVECQEEPPSIEHGQYKPYSKFHNSTVSYTCYSGFALQESSSKIHCRFGKWEGLPPTCVDTSCQEKPPTIEHGRSKSYNKSHKSKVTYVCDSGFVLQESSSKIQCRFGKWEGSPPMCVDTSCQEEPPTIEHGRHKPHSKSHNSMVTYECDVGFALKEEGTSKVQCLFGKWEGTPPTCIESCNLEDLVTELQDGTFIDIETIQHMHVPYNISLRLKCENGFILQGSDIAKCRADGAWEIPQFECIKGCASPMPTDSSVLFEPVKSFYRVGESVSLYCPPEKFLSSDVERLMCLPEGWSESIIPHCQVHEYLFYPR